MLVSSAMDDAEGSTNRSKEQDVQTPSDQETSRNVIGKSVDVLAVLIRSDADPEKMRSATTTFGKERLFDKESESTRFEDGQIKNHFTESLEIAMRWMIEREARRRRESEVKSGAALLDSGYDVCTASDSEGNEDSEQSGMSGIEEEDQTSDYNDEEKKNGTIEYKKRRKITKTYECNICGAVLKWDSRYAHRMLHMNSENARKQFKCRHCGKKFAQQGTLIAHERIHLPADLRYTKVCDVCGKRFTTTGSLNKHKRLHLDRDQLPVFECGDCGKRYSRTDHLKTHLQTHSVEDETRRPYQCDLCGHRFTSLGNYQKHQRIHLPPDDPLRKKKKEKCEICGKMVASLRLHKQTHLKDEERERPHECTQSFLTVQRLKLHENTHTRIFAFYCEECEKGFNIKRSFTKHMEGHKKGTHRALQRNRLCPVCPRKFRTESELKTHLQRHDDGTVGSSEEEEDEFRHECDECGMKFRTSTSLKNHKLDHLDGEEKRRPIVCEQCGERFKRRSSLYSHMRYKHPDENFPRKQREKVECNVCGKVISSTNLRSHMQIHLDDNDPAQAALKRQFICELCGKAYRKARILAVHMHTHTGNYPFNCAICKRGFSDKYGLREHMERHRKGTVRLTNREKMERNVVCNSAVCIDL